MMQTTLILGARAILRGGEAVERTSETFGTVMGRCEKCAVIVALAADERDGVCACCGSTARAEYELPGTTAGVAPVESQGVLSDPGEYVCFEIGGEVVVVRLTREWTRIGRSPASDVRFDDPTISRGHAVIVRGVDCVGVLDDGSLNGVFVNGQCVQWSPLGHGDEIRVGRRRLYYATR
jgi:hypothetical protein